MIEKVSPFSNSIEFDDWLEHNCCRCALWGSCYARRTIEQASWLSGEITKSLYDKTFGKDGKCINFNTPKPVDRVKKHSKIDDRQVLLFKGE